MQSKLIRFSVGSAGGLLLAASVALFIGSMTGADLIVPHDPIFAVSIHHLFWICGSAALVVSLCVLSNDRSTWPAILVAWLAAIFLIYQCGLYWQDGHELTGCLDSLARAFGISARAANALAFIVAGYLLAASSASLLWRWRVRKQDENSLKMFCPSCGGHVQFSKSNLGQQIPCPHCQATVTLRQEENLKMSCFFCKGHIEFPAHAIGTKMACPHCKMDITLKEPA